MTAKKKETPQAKVTVKDSEKRKLMARQMR